MLNACSCIHNAGLMAGEIRHDGKMKQGNNLSMIRPTNQVQNIF